MSGRPHSGSGAKLSWQHLDMAEGERERRRSAPRRRDEDELCCIPWP